MKIIKVIASLAAALAVSACATTTPSTDLTARSAAFAATDAEEQTMPTYRVKEINVTVPRTLRVSEANRYYPSGDIVWRGDPLGDRYDQVTAIFEEAMRRGTENMNGLVPVNLDIEVMRFHALTEKTRYTVGGIHAITFALSVSNAETGLALGERRIVKADLQAFGGQRAIEADRQGQTQKVRITAHLANVIRTELEVPGGHRNENLGIIQVLNRF